MEQSVLYFLDIGVIINYNKPDLQFWLKKRERERENNDGEGNNAHKDICFNDGQWPTLFVAF